MSEKGITISSSSNKYDTLLDVMESGKVKSGDTITLHEDVTIGHQVVINKKCTIDLNGHFIFVPINGGLLVKDGVAVTFDNGKIQTLSNEIIEDAIIVQGIRTELILGSKLEVSTHGTAIHTRRRGKLTIQGGSVRSTGSQPTIYVDDPGSSLLMDEGVVASYEKSAIVIRNGSSAIINAGSIYTESNGLIPETTYPAMIVNGQDSSLIVNGGSIFSEHTRAITVQASAYLEVNGGTVYSQNENFTTIELQNGNTSFKMTEGWVYSSKYSAILANKTEVGSVQSAVFLGGKVGAKGDVIQIADKGDHGITFEEGTLVKGNLLQKFIAPGFVLSDIVDDSGYAPIILKTWTSTDDKNTSFPVDDSNPFDKLTPLDKDDFIPGSFESLIPEDKPQDPDLAEPIPFPPEDIAGDTSYVNSNPENSYIPNESSNVLPDSPSDVHVDPVCPPPVPPVPPVPECGPMDPRPQPGPAPGPDTDLGPEDVPHIIYNSSVNIKHKIYIYRTPSRKTVIAEWKGALTVVDGEYFSPLGEEFARVRFRMPGSGKLATGYALVYDISHP